MKSEKSRIINYRAFAFGAVVMLLTIFFVFKSFESLWYILPLSIIFALGIIYFCIKRAFYKLIYFASVIVVTTGVLLLSVFTYNDFSINNKMADVDCRVESIYASYDNSISIIAENLKINDKGKGGRALVTIYGAEDVEIGDKLSFSDKAKSLDVFDLVESNFTFYKNKVKYKVNVNIDKVTIQKGRKTLVEKYKESTKNNLVDIMGKSTGGVCYALLFGDKTLIDEDIYKLFRESGTSHLLAISGLHISIIIAAVYFLIKKLKIKNIFKFLIMLGFLAFYCYLCDFAISVMRASIMGLILIGTKLIGKRYDSLNSLGLAAMIILLFAPLSLFSVGFLLSFMAVLSIILFSKALDRVKFPHNIVRKIVTTMFITFIVTVMTYPITATFFREVAVYSVFANLIVIPLFSVGYILLFALHLLAYIGLGFLLHIPKVIFEIIFAISNFFANIPFATIKVAGVSLIVALLIYLMLFVISKFVMVKTKIKAISCFVIFVFCATIMLVSGVNNFNTTYAYFDCYSYSAVINCQNNAYLVSPNLSSSLSYLTKKSLRQKDILSLSGIIFTSGDDFEVKPLQNFLKDFDTPKVYVPKGHSAIPNLKSSKVDFVEYDDGVLLNGNVYLNKWGVSNQSLTLLSVKGKSFAFSDKGFDMSILDFEVDYMLYDGDQTSENIGKIINNSKYIKIG